MLFVGLRLLVTNWALMLVEILPAMWIWIAMIDLKAHVLHDKSLPMSSAARSSIPIILAIALITTASFYLNAVFAFAIAKPGTPHVRPAFKDARRHLAAVAACGACPSGWPSASPPPCSPAGASPGSPSR